MAETYDFLKDVGPGWRGIVATLLLYCETHQIIVLQVKEKFGGLRFYYTTVKGGFGGSPQLDNLIDAAELRASQMCEWCGAPGERFKNMDGKAFWIKTLCPEHTTAYYDRKEDWWTDEDGKHV